MTADRTDNHRQWIIAPVAFRSLSLSLSLSLAATVFLVAVKNSTTLKRRRWRFRLKIKKQRRLQYKLSRHVVRRERRESVRRGEDWKGTPRLKFSKKTNSEKVNLKLFQNAVFVFFRFFLKKCLQRLNLKSQRYSVTVAFPLLWLLTPRSGGAVRPKRGATQWDWRRAWSKRAAGLCGLQAGRGNTPPQNLRKAPRPRLQRAGPCLSRHRCSPVS